MQVLDSTTYHDINPKEVTLQLSNCVLQSRVVSAKFATRMDSNACYKIVKQQEAKVVLLAEVFRAVVDNTSNNLLGDLSEVPRKRAVKITIETIG